MSDNKPQRAFCLRNDEHHSWTTYYSDGAGCFSAMLTLSEEDGPGSGHSSLSGSDKIDASASEAMATFTSQALLICVHGNVAA